MNDGEERLVDAGPPEHIDGDHAPVGVPLLMIGVGRWVQCAQTTVVVSAGCTKSGTTLCRAREVVRKCIGGRRRRIELERFSKSRRSPSIIGAVTEIPEHLLKRSRERRSAIGQGGDAETPAETAAAKAASSAPATTAAAAPAATGPAPAHRCPAAPPAPPVKPDPPYVVAAKQRRKIPFWAMATLSLMPIWGVHLRSCAHRRSRRRRGPAGQRRCGVLQLRELPWRRRRAVASAIRSPAARS